MSKAEWKKVGFEAIVSDCTKLGMKIDQSLYLEEGTYPIIDQGKKKIAGYRNDNIGLFTDLPAIIFGDHTRILKYIDEPFFLGADGVKLLKIKTNDVDCKYLYYYLSNQAIPNTGYNRHFKWLKEITINFPVSITSQRHIAATLDKANELIALRKKQLKELDALVETVFYDMFGDPAKNEKEWDVKRLGDIVNVRSSKRIYQRELTRKGIPFLRISDFVGKITGGVDTSELYISVELYEDLLNKGLVPKEGDILVTSRGTLGLCYIVSDSDKFYFQDGMISWLKKSGENFSSIYLSYLFSTNGIKKQIFQISSGSTVNYLSLENIGDFKILLPPLALQTRFATIIEKIEEQKTQVCKALQESEDLFQRLMQDLFKPD